jgi:hypothetical protein
VKRRKELWKRINMSNEERKEQYGKHKKNEIILWKTGIYKGLDPR